MKETTTLTGDASHLTVASYNAENLDPVVERREFVADGTDADTLGDLSNIDDDLGTGKFDTIADEILHKLNAPDIVALQEVQDSDGAELSDVTSAELTLQTLVDKINALAGPGGAHYAYIDNPFVNDDANGGQPGGNIRTAFIYRTDRVDFVEGSLRTIAADGSAISTPGANTDQADNPDNPFFDSRPPLAASFTFNGEEVTIVNNHFTSKGGSAALYGSDQPPFNAGEVQRAAQAQAVNNFVDGLLASDPNAKVMVAGDLNEFQFEEPMHVIEGTASVSNYDVPGDDPFDAIADYTAGGSQVLFDLLETLPEGERYDYVFEGNSETLDHVLVSNGLLSGAEFDVVHINAEFADQTSDHDPLVARFHISAGPIVGDNNANVLNGTADDDVIRGLGGDDIINGLGGDDLIDGGAGADRMSGGEGNDTFVGTPNGIVSSLLSLLWNPQRESDRYDGGAGSDTVDFSASDRAIVLDLENGTTRYGAQTLISIENLIGSEYTDLMGGNDAANLLRGNGGNDALAGERGNDLLFGGKGSDLLVGGDGDDVLVGGDGNDRLQGGAGHDWFVFNEVGDGRDEIVDFSTRGASSDKLVLAGDMFVGFNGDDAADLIAGGFLRARSSNNDTLVQVDVDGGGTSWVTLAEIDGRLTNTELAAVTVLHHDLII